MTAAITPLDQRPMRTMADMGMGNMKGMKMGHMAGMDMSGMPGMRGKDMPESRKPVAENREMAGMKMDHHEMEGMEMAVALEERPCRNLARTELQS